MFTQNKKVSERRSDKGYRLALMQVMPSVYPVVSSYHLCDPLIIKVCNVGNRVFRRESYSVRSGNIVKIRDVKLGKKVTPSGNRTAPN